MKRLLVALFCLFIMVTSTLWALNQPPQPKILLSGESQSSLNEQMASTEATNVAPKVEIKPVSRLLEKPSDLFVKQVNDFNHDVSQLFKKVTSKLSSMPDSEIAIMYLQIKAAQQQNLLLQQQNQIMDEIALLNANIKVLIKQNNELLSHK
ncbi:hypothetical protein L3V82_01005 [Thiotrichales bacterium 19S3-7]|nr:hypothetical protein [Thiotrichales bacterium 19S3-7]MCF6800740.1 hypothetical protein [Thiotrichales bacterium 19S3-11]